MKKILIICNYFAPYNEVAAIRITKLAKYLRKNGYDVRVLCEDRKGEVEDDILKKDAQGIPVLRIGNSEEIQKLSGRYRKWMKGIKDKKYNNLDNRIRYNRGSGKYEFYPFETAYPVIGSMDYYIELLRQYDLFARTRKFLRAHGEFDYCLSSYGDYFGLFAGHYYKECHPESKWIFDIRDAICRYKFTPSYAWPVAARLEKAACTSADAVTAVTYHLCAYYKQYNKKSYCITNGYDRSDRSGLVSRRLEEGKICFVYTGSMYGGLQDFSVLFECIRELSSEGKINLNHITFHFAGRETAYPVFERQAKKYGMEGNCVNHGRLPRKEALQLQINADILLAPIWDYKARPVGNITGKVLEYMTAGRPVITIINSDMEHNEISRILKRCRLGFVYEQAHQERDKKELLAYLEERYKEFEASGYIGCEVIEAEIESFDYKRLAKKMVRVLEGQNRVKR